MSTRRLTWKRAIRLYGRSLAGTTKKRTAQGRLRAAEKFSIFATRRGNNSPDEVTLWLVTEFERFVARDKRRRLAATEDFVQFLSNLIATWGI